MAIAGGVTVTWAGPVLSIYNQPIRVIGTFQSNVVDLREAKRLLIKAASTLDQNVTLQVLGDISNPFSATPDAINSPILCPAGGSCSIGLAFDDWHPYIGVRIIVAVAPITGILNIWSVIQN